MLLFNIKRKMLEANCFLHISKTLKSNTISYIAPQGHALNGDYLQAHVYAIGAKVGHFLWSRVALADVTIS